MDVLQRQHYAVDLVVLRPVRQDAQSVPATFQVPHLSLDRLQAV
jgi:hypothetical protein